MVPVETVCLGGNAPSDRGQLRLRHDKAQLPPPAHRSHPFGGCSHFDLPSAPNIASVTRYGLCADDP